MAFERLLRAMGMDKIMKKIEDEEQASIPITEGTRVEGLMPDVNKEYREEILLEKYREAEKAAAEAAAEGAPAEEPAPAAEEAAEETAAVAAEEEAAEETAAEEAATEEPAADTPAEEQPEEKEAAEEKPAAAQGTPEEVLMYHFERIASIPHGSGNTKALSDALVRFAKEHGYEYMQDETNNVIITAPATPGYENEAPIALQGHIDMVCAQKPGCEIDMEKEPIRIVRDGDWLRAEGTTLGADDGIAVAMMLAILDDPSIGHPLLECIFTADEEIGLIGANALDLSGLQSRRLLNLDNEEEGIFCAGCAGGAQIEADIYGFTKKRRGAVYEIELSDLTGGHSGMAIGDGNANAFVLMARLLDAMFEMYPLYLVSLSGGDADNAIPRHCSAVIAVKGLEADEDRQSFEEELFAAMEGLAEEYSDTDPALSWTVTAHEDGGEKQKVKSFGRGSTRRMLSYLINMPTTVLRRVPGDVTRMQTSINAGVVTTNSEGLHVTFMARSNINAHIDMLIRRVETLTELAGGEAAATSSYPAWEYANESAFRDKLIKIYSGMFGKEPKVEIIHAGLECGILADKLDGLDCIATGPDLYDVHTSDERMNIPSANAVFEFVKAVVSSHDE